MAINSITVWATSQAAQLQNEESYKRDAELGIRPGIADLEQANMSWHQTTKVCAAVGELVAVDAAGYTGMDFLWSESLTDLRTKIWKAINAFARQQIVEYLQEFRFVSFTEDQETTEEERARARQNMDAAPAAAIKALCDEIVAAKGA